MICSKCGEEKDISKFYFRSERTAPLGRCKTCVAEYRAALRAKDPEKFKAYFKEYNRTRRVPDPVKQLAATKKWRAAHPEQAKISHKNTRLKAAYGITVADLVRMTAEQAGKCAVCQGDMVQPCVDHNHTTGKLRMLLCHPCNLALGLLKDSPTIAFFAASYLQKFSS